MQRFRHWFGLCVPIYRVDVCAFPFLWLRPSWHAFKFSYGETSYWAGPLRLIVNPTRRAFLEAYGKSGVDGQ